MKKLPFYLQIIAFCLLIFIWDYIFMNFRSLPVSVPVRLGWDEKPSFFVPRILIWLFAAVTSFIYLLNFYLTKIINSLSLKMPKNNKKETRKAERTLSVFQLIIMLLLTVIAYESISIGLGENDALSPINNYLIVVLFLGVITMVAYSVRIAKRTGSQNLTH